LSGRNTLSHGDEGLQLATAFAHKRTFRGAIGMSALPPQADMCGATKHVCFGPIADIGTITGVQEINAATRGKITLISVNSPGRVSTSIEPPCCFTMMS
jgi:hypothetical protein